MIGGSEQIGLLGRIQDASMDHLTTTHTAQAHLFSHKHQMHCDEDFI